MPVMPVPRARPDLRVNRERTARLVNPVPRAPRDLPDPPVEMVNPDPPVPPVHQGLRERKASAPSIALWTEECSSRTERGDKLSRIYFLSSTISIEHGSFRNFYFFLFCAFHFFVLS
jgi:hypothetical protein